MKKTYIIPKYTFFTLNNEGSLMSASTDGAGENLNNVTIDNNGAGGDGQLTNRQGNSLWDTWSN